MPQHRSFAAHRPPPVDTPAIGDEEATAELLRSHRTIKLLATSSADGEPNIAFIGTCLILEDGTMAAAHVFLQRSYRNILQSKRIALLVVEPDRHTYFLRGQRLLGTLIEQCFPGSTRYEEISNRYRLREELGDHFDPFWAGAASYLVFRLDEVRTVAGKSYLNWLGGELKHYEGLSEEPADVYRCANAWKRSRRRIPSATDSSRTSATTSAHP